jgi:hypothetical protein
MTLGIVDYPRALPTVETSTEAAARIVPATIDDVAVLTWLGVDALTGYVRIYVRAESAGAVICDAAGDGEAIAVPVDSAASLTIRGVDVANWYVIGNGIDVYVQIAKVVA